MVTDILLPIMESWIGSRKIILTNIKNRRYLSGAKLSFHADQFPKYLLNIVLQVCLSIILPAYVHMGSYRDGTAEGKLQIVRTPLRVKHVSAGRPDWIFFYLKSPINFTVF